MSTWISRFWQRWRLSYEVGVPNDSSQLIVQLYATTRAGEAGELRFPESISGGILDRVDALAFTAPATWAFGHFIAGF